MTAPVVRVALLLLVLGACRFGGPSGDPSAYVDFPDPDASLQGATAGAQDGGGGDDATEATSANDAENAGAGEAGPDAPVPDADPASCTPAKATPVCDPVHDTGCDALHRCDVDPTQPTATGRCVFASSAPEGGPCSSSFLDESCPGTSTCVGTACRQPCYCDSDCSPAQCCSDSSSSFGFLLCQPCP
jgi:hypothetical protein